MSDTITIASWTEMPYTSHDKRHIKIEHRVRVLAYEGGLTDIQHERRENDRGNRTEWVEVEVVEVRDHGTRREKRREGVLQE